MDVLGLSGFNGGTALSWTGWRSFRSLFDRSLDTLRRLAPGKPVQISEVGSAEAGGSKAHWIAAMFADLRARPQVTSVLWFNLRKQADWRIQSSAAAGAAFAEAAGSWTQPSLAAGHPATASASTCSRTIIRPFPNPPNGASVQAGLKNQLGRPIVSSWVCS
ncbi:MAG: hypothetical protein ACYDHH_20055 [Solirubrobacteraceae bacterium]